MLCPFYGGFYQTESKKFEAHPGGRKVNWEVFIAILPFKNKMIRLDFNGKWPRNAFVVDS